MKCQKCSKEFSGQDSEVVCQDCVEKSYAPMAKKRGASLSWMLWWKIDADRLREHVLTYDSASFTKSARGIASICLLVIATAACAGILLGYVSAFAYVDTVICLLLALFVYLGHRWAMLGAMIYFTVNMTSQIYNVYHPDQSLVKAPGNPLIALIVWAFFMHASYFAYKVEQARRASLT